MKWSECLKHWAGISLKVQVKFSSHWISNCLVAASIETGIQEHEQALSSNSALLYRLERWMWYVSRKRRWTLTEPHGWTTQDIVLSIITSVRLSVRSRNKFIGFEVLTPVVKKVYLLSPLKVILRFAGTYRLHLKGERNAGQETSVKVIGKRIHWARLILRSWRWRRYVATKPRLTFTTQHVIRTQDMTIMRSSVASMNKLVGFEVLTPVVMKVLSTSISVESLLTFPKNISPSSSRSMNKPDKKPVWK
jgi:hypothetical protein